MIKAFLVLSLLFFVNQILFAQESGNRIYGNVGYYNQTRRQPPTNTGELSVTGNYEGQYTGAIEASVLMIGRVATHCRTACESWRTKILSY